MQKRFKPDDLKMLQQRMRMRLKFKRLVEIVVLNSQFMDQFMEEQTMTMNVKRNVAFKVRQKRKTGILTTNDKGLLRSPHSYRTIEERRVLCMIIAGLTCMSRLPPKLRARLVPYLKFEFIHADRVIIREQNDPLTVYFVVSGEIEVKKFVYERNGKRSEVSEAIIGPGDWIGEVEILERCPRLKTYVTITQCEILSITDIVFKEILGAFMKQQWQDKKHVLKSLSYFKLLTEAQIVQACSYGQLVQFDPLTLIFSETQGASSFVHFILSGECTILQVLKMQVAKKDGVVAAYKLVPVTDKPGLSSKASSMRSISSAFQYEKNLLLNNTFNLEDLLADYAGEFAEENITNNKAKRKMGLPEAEERCRNFLAQEVEMNERKSKRVRKSHQLSHTPKSIQSPVYKSTDTMEQELCEGIYEYLINECIEETISGIEDRSLESRSLSQDEKSNFFKSFLIGNIGIDQPNDGDIVHDPIFSISRRGTMIDLPPDSSSSSSEIIEQPIIDDIETHFIEVGSLSYGGVFGLGEKMTHRCIMARNKVQCLQLPRFWLMEQEQNQGHIWQRRRFYLEQCIPSREELFNNFLKTRSWDKFKAKYIKSIIGPLTVNSSKVQDIPTIAHIRQNRDVKYLKSKLN